MPQPRPILATAILLFATPMRHALPQSSLQPLDRLGNAAVTASLDSPGTPPFHLKATVQLEPKYQHPAEQGTVEFWSGPDAERILYDFPSYHAAFLKTPAGEFRTRNAAGPPYLPEYLLHQLRHPLPQSFDPAQTKATLQSQSFGKAALDCIAVTPTQTKTPEPNPIAPATYCLDPSTSDLRITVDSTGLTTTREALGAFRSHRVATQISIAFGGKPLAHLHIDLLQGQPNPAPELADTTGLVPSLDQLAHLPPPGTAGSIRPKETRVYPPLAHQDFISGSVLLHAIIGVDGRIKNLELIGSPSDGLSQSAINSVHDWTYTPFLLNGKPAEVDTTITVNYKNAGVLH